MKDVLMHTEITDSHFENKLIQVQEVVVNQFLNLSHVEMHFAAVVGH